MGLRDNFRQAVKELVDGPESAPSGVPAHPPAPGSGLPEAEGLQHQETDQDLKEWERFMNSYNSTQSGSTDGRFVEYTHPAEPKVEVSIIAPGTIVRGSIESECDLECYGEVQGDIVTTKDLRLRGKVQGNATGDNIELRGIRMVGQRYGHAGRRLRSGGRCDCRVGGHERQDPGQCPGDQVPVHEERRRDLRACGRRQAGCGRGCGHSGRHSYRQDHAASQTGELR